MNRSPAHGVRVRRTPGRSPASHHNGPMALDPGTATALMRAALDVARAEPARAEPARAEPGSEQHIELDKRIGRTDIPVGAVVAGPDGVILATARNRREADQDPTAHAEILALRDAARATGRWNLGGCTLAVTLEPCTMCAGAIVLSRVTHLVTGAPDPKAGAAGSLYDLVREPRLNHRVDLVEGVLADECSALLKDFFRDLRRRRPPDPIRDGH